MAISWRAAILVALGAVLTILYPSMSTVWGWLLLCTMICLLDLALAVSPRELTIFREVDGPVRADQTTTSSVSITNPTRRAIRLEVRDGWPPSLRESPQTHRGRIEKGTTQTFISLLRPKRRGTRQADFVSVRVWGPLGMAARQVSMQIPLSLSVLPAFHSRRLLPSRLARLQELEGKTAVMLRGPGTEFDSLREYVTGDDPRDIDWRASARTRDLVVRTWRPERDRHVFLVIDTGRTSALLLGAPSSTPHKDQGGTSSLSDLRRVRDSADTLALGAAPRLDASIEATLLLAALADRAGDNVHVLAIDRSVHARVSDVRGSALMGQIAQSLKDVSPTLEPTDWKHVTAEVRKTVNHPSLVVLLTEIPPAGSDPDFLECVTQLSGRHLVVAASARDPELARLARARGNAESVYTAAAAGGVVRELVGGCEDSERAGAIVLDEDAGLLAARLSDLYLNLKKAGRL